MTTRLTIDELRSWTFGRLGIGTCASPNKDGFPDEDTGHPIYFKLQWRRGGKPFHPSNLTLVTKRCVFIIFWLRDMDKD